MDEPGVEEGELGGGVFYEGVGERRERREVREETRRSRSRLRERKAFEDTHNRDRHQRCQYSDPLLVLIDDALRSLLRHRGGFERKERE